MAGLDRNGRAERLNHADLVAGFDAGEGGRDVFTIRDLAKECGVTARTLRFYEEKGLLTPRRAGQDRLYTRRDRARLKYVLMGKCVGFSLEEVREMLDLYDLGDGQATQLRVALTKFRERISRLERQKADIDRAIAELTRATRTVETMLAPRDPPPDPPLKAEGRIAERDPGWGQASGESSLPPSRRVARADLPLSGGGKK